MGAFGFAHCGYLCELASGLVLKSLESPWAQYGVTCGCFRLSSTDFGIHLNSFSVDRENLFCARQDAGNSLVGVQ